MLDNMNLGYFNHLSETPYPQEPYGVKKEISPLPSEIESLNSPAGLYDINYIKPYEFHSRYALILNALIFTDFGFSQK